MVLRLSGIGCRGGGCARARGWGGLLGAVVGAVWGGVYGELHEVFECPGGGAAGMTRQELPNLTRNFLDKGIPVPIGLIFDEDIFHIGQSHQVVAYGYSMNGTTMTINIYDNRFHDEECTLILDASNPGTIEEFSTTRKGASTGDKWAGLLVEDGYRPQWPSYGPDISIASPQSLQLSGPMVTAPVSVSAAPTTAKMDSRRRPGSDRKSTRLNSSHGYISYAVFCLKKKKNKVFSVNHNKKQPIIHICITN